MEFQNLGAHCADCNYYDFLPFKCGLCSRVFCQSHRLAETHNCSGFRDGRVPTCPVCKAVIPLRGGETADEAMDLHLTSNCKAPSATVEPLPLCNFQSCNKKAIPGAKCRQCSHAYCVSHRLPEEHTCRPVHREHLRNSLFHTKGSRGQQPEGPLRPKGVDPMDCCELTLYFPPTFGRRPPIVQVSIPLRWSVGKAVDWICEQFKIENTAVKRNRLVTFEKLQIVPNSMLIRDSSKPMQRLLQDSGPAGTNPDLAEGVVVVPELWLATTSVPTAPAAAATYPPSDEPCWHARVKEECSKIVDCA